tara:strand:- start:1657 stop:2124 length:468 start_codon:yes stop_codon:yes gene_type:complete
MTLYVLSVDPGKMTGVALFNREGASEPVLEWSKELEQHEVAEVLRSVLWAPEKRYNLDVVCERFIINAQTVRNSQAPYSLEVIGILKQCLLDNGRRMDDIFFQAPADAMTMFDNKKLKKLEYWHVGGGGHALDAIRHALLRLVKSGWKPIRLLQT